MASLSVSHNWGCDPLTGLNISNPCSTSDYWLGVLCDASYTSIKKIELNGPIGNTNTLLSGYIPYSMGYIKNLEGLYLYNNLLDGTLPASLGSLTALKDLRLNDNNFVGVIPSTLGSAVGLTTVILNDNSLEVTLLCLYASTCALASAAITMIVNSNCPELPL